MGLSSGHADLRRVGVVSGRPQHLVNPDHAGFDLPTRSEITAHVRSSNTDRLLLPNPAAEASLPPLSTTMAVLCIAKRCPANGKALMVDSDTPRCLKVVVPFARLL